MELRGRLIVCLIALLVALPLFNKGRVSRRDPGGAAFLLASGHHVLLRLSGDFPRPGVYAFPSGVTAATVTKMTLGHPRPDARWALHPETPLSTGDILTLSRTPGEVEVFTREKMGTQERMLFGIPLHPDEMGASDWEALPGIGPALAARIVADRQENGAFGSLRGVLRVPGVGPRTVSRIGRYF